MNITPMTILYYMLDVDNFPKMVIRRKHNSYSYWNYATKKWYGYSDAKYLTKTEVDEITAMRIIKENT